MEPHLVLIIFFLEIMQVSDFYKSLQNGFNILFLIFKILFLLILIINGMVLQL